MNTDEAWDSPARKITFGTLEPVISLRDQFAMAAMQGFITCDASGTSFWNTSKGRTDIAEEAYRWADVMLKAREKKEEK